MDMVTYALLKGKGYQGTVTALPETGKEGQTLIYNGAFYVYDGNSWVLVSTQSAGVITNAQIDALFN